MNRWEYITMYIGFGIYAGWTTTATIVSYSSFLKSKGYAEPKVDEEKVTVQLLCVACLIFITVTVRENNPYYGLVFIWTLLAINSNAA